jgi:N-acetylglucosamine malate deacetylase 1
MNDYKIMAIGAHPDDVEIGCLGTIMSEMGRGAEVMFVDLTAGGMGTNGDEDERLRESRAVADRLGIVRVNLMMGDRNISVDLESRIKLVRQIRRFRPDVVLYPFGNDRHPDHNVSSELVKQALFDSGIRKFVVDGLAPHKVGVSFGYFINDVAQNNVFYDISDHFEEKYRVLLVHESQFIPGDERISTTLNGGFVEDLMLRDKQMGRLIGAEYAETFHRDGQIVLGSLMEGSGKSD